MGRSAVGFFGMMGLLLAAPVFAGQSGSTPEVERLLQLLVQKGIVTQEEATALRMESSRDPLREKNPAVAAAAVVEKQEQPPQRNEPAIGSTSLLKISGWVQTRWTNSTGTTNSFELRRARIAIDGDLTDKMSYRIQMDAVRSPVLLDARLDVNYWRFAKLTIGQFKIPFSAENLLTSRLLIPIERSQVGLSLVPGRDNGSNGRDIGAQVSGNFLRASGQPLFEYAVGVFNGAGINRRDDNGHKDVATRLVLYPVAGFSVAGDYYTGASGPQSLARERAGVELAYVRRAYSLRGEYIWGRDGNVHKDGWYTQFAYRVRSKWEAVFRADRYDPNRTAANDATNTYLWGGNWYFSSWAKFQINYGLAKNEGHPGLSNLFMTQLQFQFKPDAER